MKMVISSAELLKGILTVSKAIPTKTTEAILEDYLFVLSGDKLELTASDKEITIKTLINVVSTEEEGKIAVPARQMTDLLKELPDQPLTIKTLNDNAFECAWAGGTSTLPYHNADDYPTSKTAGEASSTVDFPTETLLDGINRTLYASSDEDNRPIMCSIFFDITADSTTVVASDLQKLTCYTADDVKAAGACSFILNKRHAAVLRSVLSKDAESVKVTFDDKVAVFQYDSTTVICCLVAGKYPDYKSIIPKNNSNILKISRTLLLTTVKRIAVCSPKASNHIKFDLTAGSLELSAQDLTYEISAHEKIACQYDGSDLSIGFKSTHIIEMLSNLSCEEVTMKFADKRRSALLMPSEEEAISEKVFGIVMPIMVK